MNQCTCTKDAQITCIVHPTEQALKARIAELAKCGEHRQDIIEILEGRVEELGADNQRLRDPDWVTYVTLTRAWLEKYPPDIFTGVSGDPGPLFVVAVRNALIELGGGE